MDTNTDSDSGKMTISSLVSRISIEPFAAGRIGGKCVAQCLITFYYDEPRVTTTVTVIEVPCDVVDDNEMLLRYIESLEKTAIDSGLPFVDLGLP